MTAAPAAPPPRRRTWVRVLLWTTGGVVALLAALFLWVAAMLSGGFDDLLSPGGPGEDDAEVVAAGERALAELAREPLPVAGAAVAEQQRCQVGEHNWKVDDEFDLSCVATRTTLAGGDLPRFREQALALHQRLTADGWTSNDLDVARVLAEYADGRPPGDLPTASYRRGDQRLEVRWLSTGSTVPHDLSDLGSFTSPDGRAVDTQALVSLQRYVVALGLSTESFRA